MKRFLLGFYCGAALMMSTVALSFGAPLERAIGSGILWPYHVASVILFVFFGVELP